MDSVIATGMNFLSAIRKLTVRNVKEGPAGLLVGRDFFGFGKDVGVYGGGVPTRKELPVITLTPEQSKEYRSLREALDKPVNLMIQWNHATGERAWMEATTGTCAVFSVVAGFTSLVSLSVALDFALVFALLYSIWHIRAMPERQKLHQKVNRAVRDLYQTTKSPLADMLLPYALQSKTHEKLLLPSFGTIGDPYVPKTRFLKDLFAQMIISKDTNVAKRGSELKLLLEQLERPSTIV